MTCVTAVPIEPITQFAAQTCCEMECFASSQVCKAFVTAPIAHHMPASDIEIGLQGWSTGAGEPRGLAPFARIDACFAPVSMWTKALIGPPCRPCNKELRSKLTRLLTKTSGQGPACDLREVVGTSALRGRHFETFYQASRRSSNDPGRINFACFRLHGSWLRSSSN